MTKYAYYPFVFGILKVGYTDKSVISLERTAQIDSDNEPSALSEFAFNQINEYLNGRRTDFDFPYELAGTEFQKRVWKELCQIPYGETRTYKELAEAIGHPKASRAVGLANSKNPVAIAVPCHRVIGSNGSLTGYAGGLDMKKALLQLERTGI